MGAPLGPRAGSQHLLGVAALLAVGCLLAFRRGDAFCAPRSATLFIGQERGGSDGPRAAGGGGDGGAWVLAHNKAPAAAAAATAACPTAEDVAASPWARSCYHLTKVCVDQGELPVAPPPPAHCRLPPPPGGWARAATASMGSGELLPMPRGGETPAPAGATVGTLILHDDAYQPAPKGGGGSEPPSFAAEGGYGQYIYTYRNGVGGARGGNAAHAGVKRVASVNSALPQPAAAPTRRLTVLLHVLPRPARSTASTSTRWRASAAGR